MPTPDATTRTTDEALASLRDLERLARLAIAAYGEEGTPRQVSDHVARIRRALTESPERPR